MPTDQDVKPSVEEVVRELRRLELVIESAVRNADFPNWQAVCDLLNANRRCYRAIVEKQGG